jgi:hypothetical protein
MPTGFSKMERAQLRALVEEAWKGELDQALGNLLEAFKRWAGHDLDTFDLSGRIHEFHDGASRELYKRYAGLPAHLAVGYAVSRGILDRNALDPSLLQKLLPMIETTQDVEEGERSSEGNC